MLSTILIALIVVVVVVIVAYPLFKPQFALPEPTYPVLEELVRQRDAMYAAIKDLENEYATGKLSESDYRSLRAKYEAKAVALLQELDRVVATLPRAETDDTIEREVARLRRASKKEGALTCPQCGAAYAAEDVFCAKCGASLRGTRCPACGTRAAVGDKFCRQCGTTL
ncbi:MAG: zinc ribbon domain-containing protein [Anaerolineae bacterium]|nr:zinc ribbon domain-containing protein [Anaerolineae bacterium]